jgi:hypothetical protein
MQAVVNRASFSLLIRSVVCPTALHSPGEAEDETWPGICKQAPSALLLQCLSSIELGIRLFVSLKKSGFGGGCVPAPPYGPGGARVERGKAWVFEEHKTRKRGKMERGVYAR